MGFRVILNLLVSLLTELRSLVRQNRNQNFAPPMSLHPAQLARAKPGTRKLYAREVSEFNIWLNKYSVVFSDVPHLDRALVQYSYQSRLNKTRCANLYAGIAMAVPQARSNLPWLSAVLTGLQNMSPSIHSLPMPRPAAVILAVRLAQNGFPRLSVVLLVQSALGLRPSEALAITPDSVVFPGTSFYECGLIILKHGSRTKSGRPESVRLIPSAHQLEIALLHWCALNGPPNQPIAGNISTSVYSAKI